MDKHGEPVIAAQRFAVIAGCTRCEETTQNELNLSSRGPQRAQPRRGRSAALARAPGERRGSRRVAERARRGRAAGGRRVRRWVSLPKPAHGVHGGIRRPPSVVGVALFRPCQRGAAQRNASAEGQRVH
eukprot:scaffold62936_cov69-Phaeocystis_antarctica.AAC.3